MVSEQWFVRTEGMARRAREAVATGEMKILPERFEKTWFNWLDNIHDWCISRQLWWGHRIPVFYVQRDDKEDGTYVVARDRPRGSPAAGGAERACGRRDHVAARGGCAGHLVQVLATLYASLFHSMRSGRAALLR
jgi:valyl-tRNA synthetase